MSHFYTDIKVRFNHVDPAGIVFYPRYYEMLNQVIEEWCEKCLRIGFKELHQEFGGGLTLAKNEVTFSKPSRLGDHLRFDLSVNKLGRSSISLTITASVKCEQRITANMLLVFAKQNQHKEYRSSTLPPIIRERIMACITASKP